MPGVQLVLGVRPGGNGHVELAVDHAVRAVADDGELVREARVHRRRVAAIRIEAHAERGQELVVGDVLGLRADDAPGDLELLLRREAGGQRRHDAVVLASEQRLDGRQRDVLVRADVSGYDRP
jgi:hypothetical protein